MASVLKHVGSCKMFTFWDVLRDTKQTSKQTHESAQYGLAITFKITENKLFYYISSSQWMLSNSYLRLAFFTELFSLFLASLNCFQIEGKSLVCISRNSSLVIQGDRLFLTLFVLSGACLSITHANRCFQTSHIWFGLLCVVTRFQSIIRRSRKNSASL